MMRSITAKRRHNADDNGKVLGRSLMEVRIPHRLSAEERHGKYLLVLLAFIISVQRGLPGPPCPASCVLCSDKAVICHRLAHILDAPDTTKALLLTEGSIPAVQSVSLSALSNISIIGLSHNRISVLDEQSFRNLPFLHTLLLDHNLLTSQALQEEALRSLPHLQVLALGHNRISQARPLVLEEKACPLPPASSYPACLVAATLLHEYRYIPVQLAGVFHIQADWFKGTSALRSLKLEGNRITSLDAGSLPLHDFKDLESLDLSDNFIRNLDRKSFRGLVRLRNLDLSRNHLSLAASQSFSYLNWLTNLNLDLNLWNCSCQLLDLASFLSAFIQQPDKTLYNGQRMVCVSADNPAVSTVLELTEANCVPANHNITVQIDTTDSVTPKIYARDLAITAVICFIGGVALTLFVVIISYQVALQKKMAGSPNLRETDKGSSTVANYLIGHHDVAEKQSQLFLQDHHLRDGQTLSWDTRSGKPGSQSWVPDHENFGFMCADCKANGWDDRGRGLTQEEEEAERKRLRMMIVDEDRRRKLQNQKGIPPKFLSGGSSISSSGQWKDGLSPTAETPVAYPAYPKEGSSRPPEVLHCESCKRTYGQSTIRQSRIHSSDQFDGVPSQGNPFHSMKNMNSTRQTRNVTFDLESSRRWKKERYARGKAMKQNQDRGAEKKHKGKSDRMLKANLKPLPKNKVHPKRNSEPQKGKDGRKEDKQSSSERMKDRIRKKGNKPSETEGPVEDEKQGDDLKAEVASKGLQDATEGDKGDIGRGTSQVKTIGTTDPPHPTRTEVASVTEQAPIVPYQGVGSVLGVPRLSQQPLPLSPSTRIHASNLPLRGSAASPLTDSNLSTQGGALLLDTTTPVGTSLVPTGSTSSTDPNIVNRAILALGGSTDISPGGSLPVNTAHANLLQATVVQTTSHGSQPGGLGPKVGASLSHNQSLDLLSASFDTRWKSEPPPVQGPPTAESPSHLASGSEPQSLVLPIQDPESAATSKGLTPQSLDGGVPGGEAVSTSAGGRLGIEGQALQTEDIPSQGAATQSTSSSGSAVAASPLLQQEFLLEEGGSPPRRKLRLVLPEKTSSREPTALEKKIR